MNRISLNRPPKILIEFFAERSDLVVNGEMKSPTHRIGPSDHEGDEERAISLVRKAFGKKGSARNCELVVIRTTPTAEENKRLSNRVRIDTDWNRSGKVAHVAGPLASVFKDTAMSYYAHTVSSLVVTEK